MLRWSEREVIESSTTRTPGAIVAPTRTACRGTGAKVDAVQLAARPDGFKTTKTLRSRTSAPPEMLPVAGQGIPNSLIKASCSAKNSSTHKAKRLDTDFSTITGRKSPREA